MGTQSTISRMRYARPPLRCALAVLLCLLPMVAGGQSISALSTPLMLPTYIAFDAQGNLYLAETNHHAVRRVDTAGGLTTIAGDGTQGFSGDGGPAAAAQLDSPTGIAVDAANNVYVADTHNHRVRRIDAASGKITTVAGNGTAGFTGDGGVATQASLDLPSALAVDTAGNLWIADANNHRIRRVAASAGTIATVAGSGLQGFAGDGGPATAAALDSPSGLSVDAGGNLYLSDTRNQRVRMISATTGIISTLAGTGSASFSGDGAAASATLAFPRGISVDAAGNVTIADTNNQRVRRISPAGTIATVAGDGTQAFAGDGGPAVAASLDTPSSVALSPASLVTVSDTGNQSVRQIAANGVLETIAGLGAIAPDTLSLAGPATVVYGTGSLTINLVSSSSVAGNVTIFDENGAGAAVVASVPITSGAASFSTATLDAGTYHLYARYSGDPAHAAAQSATTTLIVTPAPATAVISPASILYGQSVPALSGTVTGILPQDAGKVTLVLATMAAPLSPVGSYPIAAALTGTAAGNYALPAVSGAALTIAKAPSTATLTAAAQSLSVGQPVGLTLHAASTTSGIPTGNIAVLDGGTNLATVALSTTGDASYTSSTLTAGTHTLTAVYAGDGNFTASTSPAQTIAVGNAIASDFVLAVTGANSQIVTAGGTAVFPFTVQMQGEALSSPISLAASALPPGVTASFTPNYLPPGGAVTSFTLTLQTPKAGVAALLFSKITLGLCLLFVPWLRIGAGSRRLVASSLCLGVLFATTGCGARVFAGTSAASTLTSYPITVSATATSPSGASLIHTVIVTLTVQ